MASNSDCRYIEFEEQNMVEYCVNYSSVFQESADKETWFGAF